MANEAPDYVQPEDGLVLTHLLIMRDVGRCMTPSPCRRLDIDRLRSALAAVPLPGAAGGRSSCLRQARRCERPTMRPVRVARALCQLAREYADKKRLPTHHKSALLAFAALRNAISHERYYGGRPIAEPVEAVVQEIERLRQQILEPPRALAVLGSAKVCAVHPDEPIGTALDHVRTLGYSQLPVYDGDSYAGVLTTNAIARWLADQLTRNTGIAEEEPVSHVLRFAEPGEDAVLVPRAITVVEAIDRLSRERQAGYLSTALIITEIGRRTDKPLRLVTPYDLPVLTAALAIT